MIKKEFIVLGAGVTGLSAAAAIGSSCMVIEKTDRAGGLVKTHCFDGYWFDHVLHILHFRDAAIQEKITTLLAGVLKPCPPIAWIETTAGLTLYPFQLNLGGLDEQTCINCINDYAAVYFNSYKKAPANYKLFLEHSFGKTMCEIFYFPYNNKQYKFPLEEIAVDKILWNLLRPTFTDILQGAFNPNVIRQAYNSNAFYPVPAKNASKRGMELLPIALAEKVTNLELNTAVTKVDEKRRIIYTISNGIEEQYSYHEQFLSTIPLPSLIEKCVHVPAVLKSKMDRLHYTKVMLVALCVKGERPQSPGHWRYYTDPAIVFTRLIFMTEFDPFSAPENGWGLLIEISCPRNDTVDETAMITVAVKQAKELNVIKEEDSILSIHHWYADPAYVIFTHETQAITEECHAWLAKYGITSSGRYGRWEYSSMYQNIRDGLAWAGQFSKSATHNE
ncbi:MAG: NAD(P)-binding protein [Chitinophagaceae bacterium]